MIRPWLDSCSNSLRGAWGFCTLSVGIAAYYWYRQYGKLIYYWTQGLPGKTALGLPVLGHIAFLWEGLAPWGRRLLEQHGKVVTIYLFGEHVVLMDWDAYEQHVAKAEEVGELVPMFAPHMSKLVGENSVLLLRAGRLPECARHRLIKAKMMQALAPRQVLLMAEQMEARARRLLDACAEETAGPRGEAAMKQLIDRFAYENAAGSVLGGLTDDEALLDRVQPLAAAFVDGLLSLVPVDLPIFAFGRAMDARRALAEILSGLLQQAQAQDSQRNVLAQLTSASAADGTRGLTEKEVVDSLMTVLVAGIVTTSFTIPHLIVNLWRHPEWAARIAAEARGRTWTTESSIESQGCEALKFVRETMRIFPALDVLRRAKPEGPLPLGPHGTVPAGWPVAVLFASKGYGMGDNFDPDRWTAEESRGFLGFGGHTPHQCAGKNLALLEMVILAQVLACGDYHVEVLDPTVVNDVIGLHYRGGLRVRVTRK